MLRKKCKNLIVFLLIIMIIAIARTSVAADYSCKVSLLGNKTEIKKGESITILVKATDIQAGEGIASFSAMLEYDSNIFDCTVSGDDDGTWQKQGLIENSLSMVRADLLANSSDQTIAKIVLTAKTDATAGKQSFKLTKMEFSTGEESFSVADVSTTITIKEDTENSDNNTNTNGNTSNSTGTSGNNSSTGTNTSGNSGTNTNLKNTSTITNTSSSSNSIPKTGITNVLLVGAIIGVVIAIIFYIKYKRI